MIEYPFKKIDAFATKNSLGNPTGYIKVFSGSGLRDMGKGQSSN